MSNRFSSVNHVISIFEKLAEETERKDFVVPVLPHVSPFFTGRNKEINFISDKDLLCTFMMVNAWYFTAIEPEAEKVHEYIEKAAALAAEAYTNALELIDIFYISAASCCFSLCEYETAVSLLSEAADICRSHMDILQYVDKLAELLRCLLDVYFENDDHEKCNELISEIAVLSGTNSSEKSEPDTIPWYTDSVPSSLPQNDTKPAEAQTEPAKTENEAADETVPAEVQTEISMSSENQENSDNELSLSDIKAAIENGDFSLVDPEFRQMMDEYESFYDDYIEFMKKYNSDSANIINMMGDYTEMMTKLAGWTEKIDAIDADSHSPADNAYYLLVTMRIEKKLIGSIN